VINFKILPRDTIGSPLCVTGVRRLWAHGPLPAGADTQFDENITALREPTANTFSLATTVPQDQPFVVRIGADGPILGSGEVKSVFVRTNEMTGNILERGGNPCTVRLPVVVSGDLNGAEIRSRVKIGGVAFVNGTTANWLRAQNLDEFGTGSLHFLKEAAAHSNCRAFSVWKDGVCLAK